jgi:hypothetical protein
MVLGVKHKRALVETNPPRSSQRRKLIETMIGGSLRPKSQQYPPAPVIASDVTGVSRD